MPNLLKVTISCPSFPDVYLRMDGRGVTAPVAPGGGVVNCQYGAYGWEQFTLVPQADGTVAIQSVAYPGVYLRLDGREVTQPVGPGAGVVNCQFGVGAWEKFRMEPQPDGTVAFASAAFPGVYLRMDGRDVKERMDNGGGIVNCQSGAGPWEKFVVRPALTEQITLSCPTFPGVYLRMDGSGLTQPLDAGGGTVNCQYGAHSWEQLQIVPQPNGTLGIASLAFPGVYLRMDGRGVTRPTGPGGGVVNCQYGAYAWEQFRMVPQADGTFSFASVAFPGVYLRMDGSGVNQFTASGGCTVNCQFGAMPYEKFVVGPAQ